MPSKLVDVDNIGPLLILRRKGTRSLRLRIKPDGQVTVTVPSWLPYQAGIQFAQSRKSWIDKHRPKSELLHDKQLIGKSYRIYFESGLQTKVIARLGQGKILVKIPPSLETTSPAVQIAARNTATKALKKDAQTLLPLRVENLAAKYGYEHRNIKVRNMQSRWGSCSAQKDITLNIYLIQLPWPLIDYVILHELTHTIYLNHSQKFWEHIREVLPQTNQLRKVLRQQQPYINTFDASQL